MPPKFEKLRQKAEDAIKEKNTYEALQVYRTVRNRCKDESQARECLEMLYKAALHFGAQEEKTTVLDLAEVYADTLANFKIQPSDGIYKEIGEIFNLMPVTITTTPSDSGSHDLRSKFVSDVFKWSKDSSTRSFRKLRGDPKLHKIFAKVHWEQGSHNLARLHFLLANDPTLFAKFLIEYTSKKENAEEGEAQDYLAQAVLQLLAHKKLRNAQVFFAIYCRDHPDIKQVFPFKNGPLLNFIWLLLSALQLGDFNKFVYLIEKYQPVLHGDCEYKGALDKVAQVFFKVPPKHDSGFGGMFGGLLKGLMPKGIDPSKEEFSADEEMPEESKKIVDEFYKSGTVNFNELNSKADQVNPPGLIEEPVVEKMEEEPPKPAAEPSEMDLD